jgi:fucose 4-O-acetylase-like acetyltransferase
MRDFRGLFVGKNPSIDLLKGMLILLVMAGHAMELTRQQHILFWIGAGFRMPLMMGISGYLLNVERIRAQRPQEILSRYGSRMLLPWLVAMLVYLAVDGWPVSWTTPLDLVLRPPFHLWYVSALFLLILATRIVPLSPRMLLAIGAPISLATMYAFGLDHGPVGHSLMSPDSRFLRYPVYFFFGMLMAERGMPKRYLWAVFPVALLGLWWWSALYGGGDSLAYVPARLLMCLGLLSLLPSLSALRLHVAPVNVIGRDSLFFYLWHPLVMAIVLMSGTDAGVTLVASAFILFLVSRYVVRGSAAKLLLGSVADRPAPHLPAAGEPLPVSA